MKLELGWAGPVVVQSSHCCKEAQGSSDALACGSLPAGKEPVNATRDNPEGHPFIHGFVYRTEPRSACIFKYFAC